MFGIRRYKDPDIIAGIKKGDEKMLAIMFEKNYTTAKNYVEQNYMGYKPADVLKEVVVDVWEEAQSEDFSINTQLEELIFQRLQEKTLELSSEKEEGYYQDKLNEEEKLRDLQKYMKYLPDICRSILFYTYFEKWDAKRICTNLDYHNLEEFIDKQGACKRKFSQLIKRNYSLRNLI